LSIAPPADPAWRVHARPRSPPAQPRRKLSGPGRAPAPPAVRQGPAARVLRGSEHPRCAAGHGEGGAGRAGAIVVARGEERPGGAARGAAVSASASCRSAAALGRCRVTPRSGGAGRAVRGEAFGQRRPQRESAGTARAGGESGDPRPAFPERRGATAFAALPSLQHVADSGEPGVPAAARAGGSGERARCRAGRSRPALRSAEAFSRPSWERRKGHGTWSLAVSWSNSPPSATSFSRP
ncbi:translation initiation factor IF-2-like, partial [Corvus kubaryi]|uniref:translation initiation factor IF-2-like n=1 Tax=Corvus kubaryi TaxID=68294 RepID=UPI001C054996